MSGELLGLSATTVVVLLFFAALVYYLFPRDPKGREMRRDLAEINPCCKHK